MQENKVKEVDGVLLRQCSKCKEYLDFSYFGKANKDKYGLKECCKICKNKSEHDRRNKISSEKKEIHKEKNRQYAAKKRLEMTEEQRLTKAQNCKDWRNEKLKENPNFFSDEYYKNHERNLKNAANYYYNHREKLIIEMRNWRKQNKEYFKKYNKENLKKKNEHGRKRRAIQKKSLVQYFSLEELDQRMSVFGYKCAYCGGNFEQIDHVKPIIKGGPHCLSNLRPACAKCNQSKNKKDLKEWIKGRVI